MREKPQNYRVHLDRSNAGADAYDVQAYDAYGALRLGVDQWIREHEVCAFSDMTTTLLRIEDVLVEKLPAVPCE